MIALVMQCKTANIAQIMTLGFTWDYSAEEYFHPAVDFTIMPTQTVSDTSKVQVTIQVQKAQGAQSFKKILLLRATLSDGTEDLIELHDFYRLT